MPAIDVSAHVDDVRDRLMSYEEIDKMFPHAQFVNLWGYGSEVHVSFPNGFKLAINTYRASYGIDIIDGENAFVDFVTTQPYTTREAFRKDLERARMMIQTH